MGLLLDALMFNKAEVTLGGTQPLKAFFNTLGPSRTEGGEGDKPCCDRGEYGGVQSWHTRVEVEVVAGGCSGC